MVLEWSMQKFLLTIALMLCTGNAFGGEARQSFPALMPVNAEHVCMVYDMAFAKPQIAVVVEGKTYYRCCALCEERLRNDAAARKARDPVSGADVDKATAVIGELPDHRVLYFETIETMLRYKAPT